MTGPAAGPGQPGWEVVVPAGAELGERPVWDDRQQSLIWVDICAGRLHRFSPGAGPDETGPGSTDEVIAQLPVPVGAAWPRAGGGYVLAAADGFRLAGPDGAAEGGPVRPDGMPAGARFNDGACDPAGRFWAGTAVGDLQPGAGALYRLDPDLSITRMLDGVTESNGIGWSPDGSVMYHIDSGEPDKRVRAFSYDLASGTLRGERDLISFTPADGIPDGLIVDTEGCLWIAMWGGGQLRRYTADGALLTALAVPASQPTCAAFGGPGLDELYLTTAWEGMDEAQRAADPLAGHLLRTRTGARGQPVPRYAG
ncbi:MAG: SMP-30/gluconolactonase/LRE family protein [Streptosporangiaceae bacterium]